MSTAFRCDRRHEYRACCSRVQCHRRENARYDKGMAGDGLTNVMRLLTPGTKQTGSARHGRRPLFRDRGHGEH